MRTEQLIRQFEEKLQANPEPIVGLQMVYQFDLAGEDGGTYQLHLAEGNAEVMEGDVAQADCHIQMQADDFKQLLQGKLNAASAFMFGKLKVKGDMGLAMKLQTVLGKYIPV